MCVTTTGHTSFIELVYIDTVCNAKTITSLIK